MVASCRWRAVALAVPLLLAVAEGARGDLMTDLSVEVAPVGGRLRYTYTLSNLPSSTLPVSLFEVSVAPNADLQSIGNTLGWVHSYSAGATSVLWVSAILPDFSTNDLLPGTVGMFSFETTGAPIGQPFLIVGTDPNNVLGGQTASGLIAGPGASAIPEPSSAVLVALGAAGLLAARWRCRPV